MSECVRAGQAYEDGPAWAARLREEALASFLSLGFPTTRNEEWRFTSVEPITGRTFMLPAARGDEDVPDIDLRLGSGALSAELVFLDGHYAPALCRAADLPVGVRLESLAGVLAMGGSPLETQLTRLAPFASDAFVALNTALLADGAVLVVPPRTLVERPIRVLFVSTGGHRSGPTMSHPRLLAVLGPHSRATVVECYVGPDGAEYLTNAVSEIALGEGAVLDHVKVQRESVRAYHVGSLHVGAGRDARAVCQSVSLGGSLVRNEVSVVFQGEGAECALEGLYVADGDRLVDNHTTIDHAASHCGSREIYKGVLGDRARGVFNGKIIVRPDAQKTDARQTNRALLLSPDARINTKPQLEIFANDVRCTHGAAVGQLDEEAVFYLRCRGLGEPEARRLLVQAFVGEVLQRMRLEPIRPAVKEDLARQFSRMLQAAA